MSAKKKRPRLRIIPLGGVGEIGKNMTVYEYDNDIIAVSYTHLTLPTKA